MRIDRKTNTIRNVFWGYISKIFELIIPFIFRTIIIKVLGDDYLGLNSLFTSILQVLSLSELGFGSAIVYSMYKPIVNNDKDKIDSLLRLYRKVYKIIGLVILAIGLVSLPFIKYLIHGSYPTDINIYLVYLFFLINTVVGYFLFAYKNSIILAFQRNDLNSKALIVTNIIKLVLQLISLLFLKNYYFFLISLIITTIINNIINALLVRKYYPQYVPKGDVNKEEKQEIKKNVVALFFHKIGSLVLNSSDNIVISSFLGLTILTLFSNYYYIITSVEVFIILIFTSMLGGLGNSLLVESKENNKKKFDNILFLNAYLAIVCGTLMFVLFKPFITMWLGTKYLLDIKLEILFVIYFYIHIIRRTIIAFRDASGSWNDNKYQPIVSATTNIILNISLVNIIGLYGIIISTLISMIFIDVPWEASKYLNNYLNIKCRNYFISIFKYFIILAISCLICFEINNFINISNIYNFIIYACVAFFVSNILFIFAFIKSESLKYYLSFIKKIFFKFKFSKKQVI